MNHKYGEFTSEQIKENKQYLRKQIYFLLLIVDPSTSSKYEGVDVNKAFDGLLSKIGGMNSLLKYPPQLVRVMSLLEAALIEYNNPSFKYTKYRKLVLDAGAEVLEIEEV